MAILKCLSRYGVILGSNQSGFKIGKLMAREESRKLVDVDQFDEKTLCFSPKKTTVKMVEFAYSRLGKVVELIEDE